MIPDEAGLAAYLEGDLGTTETEAWDEHLLGCNECWTALEEARRGRALAASLHDAAPSGLRTRVVVTVEGLARPNRDRRPRRLLVSVGAAVASIAVLTGALVVARDSKETHEARPIAVVLRLAANRAEQPPAADKGVRITRLNVSGRDVVFARAEEPFPMPVGAIALTDDPHSPWLARRGDVSLLCFSQPAPILLAGRASPQTLTEVASALGIFMPGRNQTAAPGVPYG